MPDMVFLPYRFADEALEIHVLGLQVDGRSVEPDDHLERDAHQINLSGLEHWDEATFNVQVRDASRQIPTVLMDGEDPSVDARIYILLRNPKSRIRHAVTTVPSGDSAWEGSFCISRQDWIGSVSMEAMAVREHSREEKFGFATRAGERIAGSCKWSLYVDDRPILPGGAINGEWRDFSTDVNPELRARAECGWYLDLVDHERPTLYLNEGIKGLRKLLEVAASRGRSAYLRDVTSHTILAPLLVEMGMFAVTSLRGAGFEEIADWRRGLLLTLARFSDGKSEEAMIESWLAANDSDAARGVLCDLTTAVQLFLGTFATVAKLIQSLEGAADD
jgi:hypothetical protein